MARRPLPSSQDAARILAERRTRPARRPPPPAGRALAKYVKALEERFGPGASGLAARWREIVGETLARRTEPVKLVKPRNGTGATLELRVDGAGATLIQHQQGDILERVNLHLGAGTVARLRIVQGPVRFSPAKPSPFRNRAAPPLDAAAEARLANSLASAPDGPLKHALLKLGREVMRHSVAEDRRQD